jgi:hypothetical protein
MPESEIQTKEETVKTRSPRLSSEKALPQSGADTLVRIIKGYAVASSGGQTKINYKDVASAAGVNPFVVSGNNRFLMDSEILSSPKYGYYIPTENAVRFAREAAWDEVGAKVHLRKIVADSWYGQIASQNFALRPTLTRAELKRALAIKAGASEGDSTALDFLIDFMIFTGLVAEDERGLLKKGDFDEELSETSPLVSEESLRPQTITRARTDAETERRTPSLLVHLHIRDMDQLTPENAKRVREWVSSITDSGELADRDRRTIYRCHRPRRPSASSLGAICLSGLRG